MQRQPALFLGHGNPLLALGDHPWRQAWQRLGQRLASAPTPPRAILCVSAHWQTRQPTLCSADPPVTLHDFSGFPAPLYAQRYPAPGAPSLVRRAQELAPALRLSSDWGLDHGAWCLLQALFPAADVPVAQLSLGHELDFAAHLALARRLAPLRAEGVLLLASGNGVHNLGRLREGPPADWALRFDARLGKALETRDEAWLLDPWRSGEDARLAIPTVEHYLPLLHAFGWSTPDETLAQFNTDIDLGSIGMRCAAWGL